MGTWSKAQELALLPYQYQPFGRDKGIARRRMDGSTPHRWIDRNRPPSLGNLEWGLVPFIRREVNNVKEVSNLKKGSDYPCRRGGTPHRSKDVGLAQVLQPTQPLECFLYVAAALHHAKQVLKEKDLKIFERKDARGLICLPRLRISLAIGIDKMHSDPTF
jgi:hypothetical protein